MSRLIRVRDNIDIIDRTIAVSERESERDDAKRVL